MKPLTIAGDVSLHVLDDEGILFAESRQELHSTNTAATFLWCLLEEGLPFDRLIATYASTFGLTVSEAATHVSPTLRRWFGLGHISAPDMPAGADTPFGTALAFLLTNDDLRRAFRGSPETVARALAIEREGLDAFLTLDPDALDRQADDIVEHRRRQRHADFTTSQLDASDLLEKAARVRWLGPCARRLYRLVDTTFLLTIPLELDARVHRVLAHLDAGSVAKADVELHVRTADEGYVIFDGLMPLIGSDAPGTLVPWLKVLLRRLAVARHRYFMEIHAGVVGLADRAVLLPGASGRGKTTMTAALAWSGARYFSDEIALLEDADLSVRPLPLTMTIKPGSVDPLRPFYPDLDMLDEHLREDRQPVRYLPPPVASRCDSNEPPRPVRWVVFPSYEPGVETALIAVKRAHGFRRLLDESLVLPGLLDRRRVERLVAWARGIAFYDLRFSSLDRAVAVVWDLAKR